MSEETDLERDERMARALARLPQPSLPAGLADRIVGNVSRLPQGVPAAEEPVAAPAKIDPARRRHRVLALIGTAIAASVVGVILLWNSHDPKPDAPADQVASVGPAEQPPGKDAGAFDRESSGVRTVGDPETGSTSRTKKSPVQSAARSKQAPALPAEQGEPPPAESGSRDNSPSASPSLAGRESPVTPEAAPTEESAMGAPAATGLGIPGPIDAPSPGLGIVGPSSAPSASPGNVNNGHSPGARRGGPPRF